jgi:M6 family metalloprotease-like protein
VIKQISFIGLVITLLLPIQASPSYAAVKAGVKCTKAGSKSVVGNKTFTCIKSGKKLVWNKGVAVKKPTPTPKPLPIKDVSQSLSMSDPKLFNPPEACRISDLSFRVDTSNGFPRPNATLNGKSKALVLVLPVSFTDQVFGDEDLTRIRNRLDEVEQFYKKMSYGKFELNFEIPAKADWVTIEASADSYNLVQLAPQQNNYVLVEKIFQVSSQQLNFDKYDAVILETKPFYSTGGGQGFPSEEFKTSHGTAKRVTFESGNGAGNARVIAHELGHTLFGLEDLYVFLNSSRPSTQDPTPAGNWDFMSSIDGNVFGWSKYLNGWLEDTAINCATTQNSLTTYLSKLDAIDARKKLFLINSAPGVVIGAEVRLGDGRVCITEGIYLPDKCLGLLIYTVDTNVNHGNGPIVAQKNLLYMKETLTLGKYQFKVEDFDDSGLLVTMNRIGN